MPARKTRAATQIIPTIEATNSTQLAPNCHSGTLPRPQRSEMVRKEVVGKRVRVVMNQWPGFLELRPYYLFDRSCLTPWRLRLGQ